MARKARRLVRYPQAIVDIVELADGIAARSGLGASDRFILQVQKGCALLAGMPGLGTLWPSDQAHLVGLRYVPVPRFPNHLIFYRDRSDQVEIIRVLHGARDIASLLAADEEISDA